MAITPTLFVTILASRNPETGNIEPEYTPAQVLWVDQSEGSDTVSNGLGVHGSEINPYETINKAQSVLQPSGEIHVKSGRYFEFTIDNPFVPVQALIHPVYAATAPRVSGTSAHPCVLRAAAGHEESVIIDGGDTYAGLVSAEKDNWIVSGIRFENCVEAGLASQGQAILVPDISRLSENWLVENCCVAGVSSQSANGNVSGIAPWGSRNWVIRNCLIHDIRRFDNEDSNRVACIQTYGAINLQLQNVHGYDADYGLFVKDHFIYPDLVTTYQGTTIDSCRFETRSVPIYFSVRGGDTAHMGDTVIRNSIAHHTGVEAGNSAVYCHMNGGLEQSTKITIQNCILRVPESGTTSGFFVSGVADARYIDCIMVNGASQIITVNEGEPTLLTQCDRNAYSVFNNVRLNAFGAGDTNRNWTNWRLSVAGDPSSLGVSNPDSLSVIASTSDMFIDMELGDYRFKAGSPTIGLAGGGLNAGCYQTNLEHIGLLPTYSAGV